MFESPERLLFGLLTGFLFGFFLQKGRVADYAVIVGQFLLRDFTMLKVMLTAIAVGGIGAYVLFAAGLATPQIKPLIVAGVVPGAALFGIGIAILGYCPGTSVAAMATGSRHALLGVLGMLCGAAVFAEVFPWINAHLLKTGDYGSVTLSQLTGVSPWLIFAALLAISAALFWLLETRFTPQPAGSNASANE